MNKRVYGKSYIYYSLEKEILDLFCIFFTIYKTKKTFSEFTGSYLFDKHNKLELLSSGQNHSFNTR